MSAAGSTSTNEQKSCTAGHDSGPGRNQKIRRLHPSMPIRTDSVPLAKLLLMSAAERAQASVCNQLLPSVTQPGLVEPTSGYASTMLVSRSTDSSTCCTVDVGARKSGPGSMPSECVSTVTLPYVHNAPPKDPHAAGQGALAVKKAPDRPP